MATKYCNQPLIVIVGPTASGKTELALKIAKQHAGEIISADSRTVYKYLSIGTAKPEQSEQESVPHHLIDVVDPDERFTAADFKYRADKAIQNIRERGKLPILVGGTGLYINAVLFDYGFGSAGDSKLRSKLEVQTIEQLQEYCIKNNIKLPENYKNKRYLIRAIEQKGVNTSSSIMPLPNSLVVGISTRKATLKDRIQQRVRKMLMHGVVKEASEVAARFGWENEAMKGNVYPPIRLFLEGKISEQEMINKINTLDWRLAKRQLTWLRRNPSINWLDLRQAEKFLESYLSTVKTCYYRTR